MTTHCPTFIFGQQRTGKTTLEKKLIDQLLSSGEAEIILIDLKGDAFSEYRANQGVELLVCEKDDYAGAYEALALLQKKINGRIDDTNVATDNGDDSHRFQGKPLYVFIDEMVLLMRDPDKEHVAFYEKVLSEAALVSSNTKTTLVLCTCGTAPSESIPRSVSYYDHRLVVFEYDIKCLRKFFPVQPSGLTRRYNKNHPALGEGYISTLSNGGCELKTIDEMVPMLLNDPY